MTRNLFEGKNVLVVGGNSGIGLAAAKAFSQEGANLISWIQLANATEFWLIICLNFSFGVRYPSLLRGRLLSLFSIAT